jgi:hypothetical protein
MIYLYFKLIIARLHFPIAEPRYFYLQKIRFTPPRLAVEKTVRDAITPVKDAG